MRDALGGIVNIELIVVFLILINGYLAFSVNYTKAFRVKNKILTVVEQYEGDIESDAAVASIKNYVDQVGYSTDRTTLDKAKEELCNDTTAAQCTCKYDLGFCYRKYELSTEGYNNYNYGIKKSYYRVVTVINIEIPILKNILELVPFFRVKGDTKTIIK